MKETIKLKCEKCNADYDKPSDLKRLNEEHPNVFFKWSLLFCDDCRRKKEREAIKSLPEVLKVLSDKL